MTSQQAGFYKEVSTVLSEKENISVGLVQNDKNDVGGQYSSGQIDVSDIAAIGDKNKAFTSGSALAHEIVEQSAKQKDRLGYQAAHDQAIIAESHITGYMRDDARQQNNGALISGTVQLQYYGRIAGFAWGIPYFEKITVTVSVTNNDITKPEEK